MAIPIALIAKLGSMLGGKGKGGDKGGASQSSSQGGFGKGPGVPLAMSMIQQIQANKLKKQANAARPDLVDPNQSGFLAELLQKRKSIDTGSAFATGIQNAEAGATGTQEAITRNTGGDVASTIQGLLQSQRVASDAKNQVLSQGQNQQLQYTGMYGDLLNRISARKMQLQNSISEQFRAEWANKQQNAQANRNIGIAKLVGGPRATAGDAQATQIAPQSFDTGVFDKSKLSSDADAINSDPSKFMDIQGAAGTEALTSLG